MVHQDDGRAPLIVSFVADLMSATRIEGVALQKGYQIKTVGQAEALVSSARSQMPERPGEPVQGPLADLVDQLTAWQPALLIFDLSNQAVPWRQWLPVLKSSPATRRIPVICFGPHVDQAAVTEAHDLVTDSDAVVSRSRFFKVMPEMFAEFARATDHEQLTRDCARSLSTEAIRGLEAFNRAEYFEAHEHLEIAWNEDQGAARELYRAVLQIAVAYLQVERSNYRGAVKMFLRARQWLAPLPDVCRGIDVRSLRTDAELVYQAIVALGPEEIQHFDLQSLPPVRYSVTTLDGSSQEIE